MTNSSPWYPQVKHKPKQVPDYFKLSLSDADQLLQKYTTLEERRFIFRYYEFGALGLRGLANSSQEDIMDRFQKRSTLLRDESCERKIVGVSFRFHKKPWVICPHPKCIVKSASSNKLVGLFKLLQPYVPTRSLGSMDGPEPLWEIGKAAVEAYEDVMDEDCWVTATFCPQQTYSRHTNMRLAQKNDPETENRPMDRFLMFGDETSHVYALIRERTSEIASRSKVLLNGATAEECLLEVMRKLVEARSNQRSKQWRPADYHVRLITPGLRRA